MFQLRVTFQLKKLQRKLLLYMQLQFKLKLQQQRSEAQRHKLKLTTIAPIFQS
jgi:hypothetical protein